MPKEKEQLREVSLSFAIMVVSLLMILGFVIILSMILQTQDFLYDEFQQSHQQMNELRQQIEQQPRF